MAIHPTAIIDPDARIDSTAIIGPYCVIEGPVQIGPRTMVGPFAQILGHTEIGCDCQIHASAIVGDVPQDRSFAGDISYCRIGDGTILREHVTVHRGSTSESVTSVGQRCYVMAGAHIGHNCQVHDEAILSDGRFLVTHEGGLRMQNVTSGVRGRDVQSFAAEANRRLKRLSLPAGVSLTVTGEHEAKRATERELLLLGSAAGIGIVLLLWMAFQSLRLLLLVLLNLPFALVGGVAAVYAMGNVLSVGSLVGFVTLFGITMRNGIMMVSHWQHLHETEGLPWGPELVFQGARERLAPVLMTALVTGLGLMPIALGSGQAGREIEGPMAIVILGGLVTSTALNLFALPVLYHRFGPSQSRAREF